ncbi:MAG: cytochrome-c oxidase, cbb3-type subunit III [Pseudomonadota bacterium]
MADATHGKDVDQLSGVETTGHEWDGIKELNNPLPKWWLYTFYVTIVWAVIYWILMPSWPLATDYLKGVRGHSQRALVAEQLEALKVQRAEAGAALETASLEEIVASPEMLTFAMANGTSAFGDNCSACHGTGAQGFVGYPNLNDDDWLWGGSLEDIHVTLLHGINWDGSDETRFGGMMAFGEDELLSRDEIVTVANYVRGLSGLETREGYDAALGEELFIDNCSACHMETGEGMVEVGAPNLTDGIWLYGSSEEKIIETIHQGRQGVMPGWQERLDPVTIKSLAVYVHTLGGGQ